MLSLLDGYRRRHARELREFAHAVARAQHEPGSIESQMEEPRSMFAAVDDEFLRTKWWGEDAPEGI